MRNFIGIGLAVWLATLGCANVIAAQRMEDGRRVYVAHCARCHDTGIAGAPITGQPGDWSERSDLWDAVLFEHVKQGYLSMPAKGGQQDLTDYEVSAAAEYMLNVTHPEMPQDSAN